MSECLGCKAASKLISKLEDEIMVLKMPMTFSFMGYSEAELMKIIETYQHDHPKAEPAKC